MSYEDKVSTIFETKIALTLYSENLHNLTSYSWIIEK